MGWISTRGLFMAGGSVALAGLLTAAPAGAAPASAAAVPAVARQAGYVATGSTFRYVQAVIMVPGLPCTAGADMPRLYVTLAGPGEDARAGVLCEGSGPWRGFVQVSDSAWRAPVFAAFALPGVRPGQGVFASVYAGTRGSAQCSLTLPDGATVGRAVQLPGRVFTQAGALADWAGAGGLPAAPVPAQQVRVTRFLSGAITTETGQRGVFTGPWTKKGKLSRLPWALRRYEVAAAGRGGHPATAAPSYLWSDGTQSVFGSRGNAFGIWLHS
ncbi:MAG TPA: hypothetical protein VGS19_26165 [Streptosporangiaceae bacterium]|nr:hypothetical protein [Streptosporangiaceae bacterium]